MTLEKTMKPQPPSLGGIYAGVAPQPTPQAGNIYSAPTGGAALPLSVQQLQQVAAPPAAAAAVQQPQQQGLGIYQTPMQLQPAPQAGGGGLGVSTNQLAQLAQLLSGTQAAAPMHPAMQQQQQQQQPYPMQWNFPRPF